MGDSLRRWLQKLVKYRSLQIAFSTTCGILCLLFVIFWILSYWRLDQFVHQRLYTDYVVLTSAQGRILIGKSNDPTLVFALGPCRMPGKFYFNNWDQTENVAYFPASLSPSKESALFPWLRFDRDFYVQQRGVSYEVTVPYWLLALPFAMIATAPWVRWRFSLRALLIAVTLMAALLVAVVRSIE